jgi:ribosomal-protein-alanine N-acetyltransferase
MTIITQTSRLIIREFGGTELETFLNHFVGEEFLRYIPKRTREQRITIFNTALEKYSESKTKGIWGIFSKADGAFVGSCLLRPFDNLPEVLELGYSIEQKLWGLGYATEMAAAMVAHAFTDNNIEEVRALTSIPNIASQRVLEKAGLKRGEDLSRDGEELACFRLSR